MSCWIVGALLTFYRAKKILSVFFRCCEVSPYSKTRCTWGGGRYLTTVMDLVLPARTLFISRQSLINTTHAPQKAGTPVSIEVATRIATRFINVGPDDAAVAHKNDSQRSSCRRKRPSLLPTATPALAWLLSRPHANCLGFGNAQALSLSLTLNARPHR